GEDTITFAIAGTINLTKVLPDLNTNVRIEGPGANLLTVQHGTGGNYRIFRVGAAATVSISGVTVANGYLYDVSQGGGGIYNAGTLTVRGSAISGNFVAWNSGEARGGGIYNEGEMTLSNSTVSGNQVWNIDLNGCGSGIYNAGVLTVSNSTISGNGGGYAD